MQTILGSGGAIGTPLAKELKKYRSDIFLLANMTEFGKTPLIKFSEFERVGYSCVIYPVSTLRVAMGAV